MRKKGILSIIAIMLCMCIVCTNSVTTYAWNKTASKKAYSSYYGYSMGTLEARIWVSMLQTNLLRTKVTFDATSSSWVFNANKSITKHQNSMTIRKTGLTGDLSLSVSESGPSAGISISEKTDSLCTISTPSSSSYYRGINSYNNTITRGIFGTLVAWNISALANVVVTGTSKQTVYLDGQMFNNSATVSAYF